MSDQPIIHSKEYFFLLSIKVLTLTQLKNIKRDTMNFRLKL